MYLPPLQKDKILSCWWFLGKTLYLHFRNCCILALIVGSYSRSSKPFIFHLGLPSLTFQVFLKSNCQILFSPYRASPNPPNVISTDRTELQCSITYLQMKRKGSPRGSLSKFPIGQTRPEKACACPHPWVWVPQLLFAVICSHDLFLASSVGWSGFSLYRGRLFLLVMIFSLCARHLAKWCYMSL